MAIRELRAKDIGPPVFTGRPAKRGSVFDLPSHARARDALAAGLGMTEPGFNIFVLGPERSGRMTETLDFIEAQLKSRKGEPPSDWLYLNNFERSHRPKPYALPPGEGQRLRAAMTRLIADAREALKEAFGSDAHRQRMAALEADSQTAVDEAMRALQAKAGENDLALVQSEEGTAVAALGPEGKPVPLFQLPAERQAALREPVAEVLAELNRIARIAADARVTHARALIQATRELGGETLDGLLQPVVDQFGGLSARLTRWFGELREDMLDNLVLFALAPGQPGPDGGPPRPPPEQRYAVNLLVDNGDADTPPLVLEANPTYERLIGRIEYRPAGPHMETDFSLVRAGALHRANGGVLVLRAEALFREPGTWDALKAALRDQKVQIEERLRQNSLPMASAPNPKPVPLSVKVVLVGAPAIYYSAFSLDPDFIAYFKIKADIDESMPADAKTRAVYRHLIHVKADRLREGRGANAEATDTLLALAARWADDRARLTARQELLDDILAEAHAIAPTDTPIGRAAVIEAVERRRTRNGRIEDRSLEQVLDGTVLVATRGAAIGQINGLTVRDMGDHRFGSAARVTARASVGQEGIINIERQVAMGGPIQQKGALVLQGYLAGLFARRRPMSFDCSITFEQNYGGVEGDSATLAEVLAVLSDLAEAPLRQDLAITGSMNQRGEAQAVGGVIQKVEGFFRLCAETGLSGDQGVILPRANARHLILREDVTKAVAERRFHIHTIDRVEDAVEILTGLEVGKSNARGAYPKDSLFGRVQARLGDFDRLLTARASGLASGREAD